ncbi:hypothetical protein DPMN_120517 [Dreissena polymorpha]|uniref:Uncharacterized protein n=1 Tax=Dreissena polymorpha TaxID=45954 RepID=A0A9D4GJY0_DREPO|nr:hypothetical protein DPMN_120517 [Dreissena polymorpha]
MLAASLRGAARNFYMSLTDDERRNYCTLTTRLSERFGNDSKQQWLNKLENRRRSKGESIASLADDLRQLCEKAYTDLDHRSQNKLALNQLYKLVSTEMKCRCMDHNCLTVNEAVSVMKDTNPYWGRLYNQTLGQLIQINVLTLNPLLSELKRALTKLKRLLCVYHR